MINSQSTANQDPRHASPTKATPPPLTCSSRHALPITRPQSAGDRPPRDGPTARSALGGQRLPVGRLRPVGPGKSRVNGGDHWAERSFPWAAVIDVNQRYPRIFAILYL